MLASIWCIVNSRGPAAPENAEKILLLLYCVMWNVIVALQQQQMTETTTKESLHTKRTGIINRQEKMENNLTVPASQTAPLHPQAITTQSVKPAKNKHKALIRKNKAPVSHRALCNSNSSEFNPSHPSQRTKLTQLYLSLFYNGSRAETHSIPVQ